jgi:hypothetical protein
MYDKIAYLRLRVARLEKLADLSPPLGTQDSCYSLERAKKNNASIVDLAFIKEILNDLKMEGKMEEGHTGLKDVSKKYRSKFYKLTYPKKVVEQTSSKPIGKGRRKTTPMITSFTLTAHAQFRMDHRGVTVDQVENVLRNWQLSNRQSIDKIKEKAYESEDHFNDYRELKHRSDEDEAKMREHYLNMSLSHKADGVFVGFVPKRDGSVVVKTVFNLRKPDEPFKC